MDPTRSKPMAVDTSHPAAHRRASPGVPSVATAQGRRIGTAASRVARCACLALGVAGAAQAAGLGMAFTYQGELQVSGTPAEGVYDLEFVLFPVDDGGSAVATH